MHTYSCVKDFKNARRCIERYEAESGYFDKDGNIEKGREIYYYNKAVFYLGVNKADSAYAYLCKLQQAPEQTLNTRIATARGLSLLYDKLGNADSTAKYALLSYELDDSLCTHLMKSGSSIQQTQYNRPNTSTTDCKAKSAVKNRKRNTPQSRLWRQHWGWYSPYSHSY